MHDEFQRRLLSFAAEPDAAARKAIEAAIWAEYGRELCVFVLDMSGFSRLAQRYGIVHYLSMVTRMQTAVEPIVERHDGTVVKFEADNCFAVFEDVPGAIHAAVAANRTFASANAETPQELDIHVSCGIDYGDILLVDDRDLFGNAVNRASKLGEDVASPGEILVTRSAMDLVPPEQSWAFTTVELSLSGIDITACAVEFE